MPRTGNSGYDTATNTFRPLPLPSRRQRKLLSPYDAGYTPHTFAPIPKGPKTPAVKFPKGVSNGKY